MIRSNISTFTSPKPSPAQYKLFLTITAVKIAFEHYIKSIQWGSNLPYTFKMPYYRKHWIINKYLPGKDVRNLTIPQLFFMAFTRVIQILNIIKTARILELPSYVGRYYNVFLLNII